MRNMIYKDSAAFFRDAATVHDGVYDYSESVFLSTSDTITYKCPTHGAVTQRAGHHLDGSGCKHCNLGLGPSARPAFAAKERARTLKEQRRGTHTAHAHLAELARQDAEGPEVTAYLKAVLSCRDGAVFLGGVRVDAPRADGYRMVNVLSRRYLAHRLVWLITTGHWPLVVDHVNGDHGDNRPENLRSVDTRCNAQNQYVAHRGKKSGLPIGVYTAHDGKFRATIRLENNKQRHLGTFATPELAHAAYLGAKAMHQTGATHD